MSLSKPIIHILSSTVSSNHCCRIIINILVSLVDILKSQKGSEKEGRITAISFICDSISNILFGNLGECI